MYTQTTRHFQVHVEPVYVEAQSRPDEGYFFFAYKVRIVNEGPVAAQLLSRYWIVVDGNGQQEEIKGAGVVGQQPRIEPGSQYEYTSFCPLSTPTGNMRGVYEMLDDRGDRFEIQIPLFFFRIPQMLH